MRTKQSILEEYSEMEHITVKDIKMPQQKYIHFWDFMELSEKVHEFQARMGLAINDLKRDMKERYRNFYTTTYLQSPDKFIRHNKELAEIEYMLENPFFLAILHSTLTKEVDDKELRFWAFTFKKRLMERRLHIKENLQEEIEATSEFLIR